MPPGYYGHLTQRLTLAFRPKIRVYGPIVDRGYNEQINLLVVNQSDEDFEIKHGDRLIHFIPLKVFDWELLEFPERIDDIGQEEENMSNMNEFVEK